ncbi:hypothetical protein BIV24_30720 [Streptomyces colonosanans]|uniref:Uncharacterized protein n=1 Tax=Streptomyces colonosanans TaxID=1428652 RepID=A0A1S2NTQ0_9ACTN|nr:hypothetical protein BIV24_30720 [Streptomyces colonosanans]
MRAVSASVDSSPAAGPILAQRATRLISVARRVSAGPSGLHHGPQGSVVVKSKEEVAMYRPQLTRGGGEPTAQRLVAGGRAGMDEQGRTGAR